jgi:two-component system OmpR family sensor kinase
VVLRRTSRAFVQGASDALRDPLTICRGHLELLTGDLEEQRRTLALVMDELDRMAQIVDYLQLLAETDRPETFQPEPIDLELLTHDLVAEASALARRAWTLDASAAGTLLADRLHLTEAVMSLADNAVQHTLPEDVISMGSSADEDEVRIWVRDTGVGIPESDQERIFESFARGADAHMHYRGRGLGLAVVKAIAEEHGGRVELESHVGEGSTFTIVLPRNSS